MISCLTITQPQRWRQFQHSIQCLLAQTFSDYELVVVHDGNQAFDTQLCEHLGGLPLSWSVDRQQQGQSLGELRQCSVDLAAGDWVCQWDDDDYFHPDRLAQQWARAQQANADACFLTEHLHWFTQTNLLFWNDWNRSDFPFNLIEGTLLARKDRLPDYPALPRGEDTPVVHGLIERGCTVATLGAEGAHLQLYTFHGSNAWDQAHHVEMAQAKARDLAWLEAHQAELQHALGRYPVRLPDMTMPHAQGVLTLQPSPKRPA